MRSNFSIFCLAVLLCGPGLSFAQGRTATAQNALNTQDKTDALGVGLQLGSLSGVNAEYWLAPARTLNASFTGERGNLALTAAHTWLFPGTFSDQFTNFIPFVGAGALGAWGDRSDYFRRSHNENFAMAVQVPVGIEFLPHMQRFGVFAELAPSLQLIPESLVFLTGDVGARYYF